MVKLHLQRATKAQIDFACREWHYLKRTPWGAVGFAVYENDVFIGVVVFGPAARLFGVRYQLLNNECNALSRVALTQHITPVTRIVRIALQLLKQLRPHVRVVVSHADSGQGHTGAIYRAGNWLYTGSNTVAYPVINGEIVNTRTAKRKGILQNGVHKYVKQPVKHRFVMPLDAETRTKILQDVRPWPIG